MSKKFYLGMAVAAGIILGSLCTAITITSLVKTSLEISLPIGVRAATATGNDNFSVATGQIDENVEGLFLLEGLTGDLTCHVISTFTGEFFARLQVNVLNDLDLGDDKNTRLLMVTGLWNYRNPTSGQLKPSDTLIYVVDSTSGNFAAYTVPWSKIISHKSRQGNHFGELQLVAKGTADNSEDNP